MSVVIDSKTKLTYSDYALFPDDGKIHEIIDGEHYMSPSPSTYHQTVSRRIQFQLYRQIEEGGLGQVYDAPTDVELSQIDIVVPDLLVILEKRKRIITPAKVTGAPDLVVEILSESTSQRDRELKLSLYQKSGVPEYWLVDPVGHTVERYLLERNRYRLDGTYGDEIAFAGLGGVKVDLRQVW